jgi:bifunctional non-homologous end joining protein LigD
MRWLLLAAVALVVALVLLFWRNDETNRREAERRASASKDKPLRKHQNVGGKTIASVYAVRPLPGAPVSTPLRWDEVGHLTPDLFTIETIWRRIEVVGDLFAPVLTGGQNLNEAEPALGLKSPS